MGSIMIDDSRTPFENSLNPESEGVLSRFSEITKYQIARYDAYTWAQNLHFLTYDDSDNLAGDGTSDLIGLESGKGSEPSHVPPISSGNGKALEIQDISGTNNHLEVSSGIWGGREKHPNLNQSEFYDSNYEQQMLDRAIALSLAEQDNQSPPDIKPPDDDVSNNRQDSSSNVEDSTCDFCDFIPLFPSNKKPKTFRVTPGKPNDVGPDACLHYVAVSYCWPKDKDGNPIKRSTTYRVRTKNESGETIERRNRAPDYVIDRAVEYAAAQGICLIWIDQECLPQDNSRE